MTGAQQLRDWIERRGYNQVEASRVLGIHEAFVSMLINGKRTPGLDKAVRIERLTGIPVAAWTSSAVNESNTAGAGAAQKRAS
jgi:plasmid maintenance system antidote protein VapI